MWIIHTPSGGRIRFENVYVTEAAVVECRDSERGEIKLYLNASDWNRIEWTP